MYINTDAANRGAIVRAFNEAAIHSARLPPDTNALLEPFVDRAPPPTYLEATTPCLWSSRRSGDEASRLLPSDGRPSPAPPLDDPLDGVYRGPTSDRRRLQDKWARSGVLTCSVAVILTMTLVIATAFVVAHSKDSDSSTSTTWTSSVGVLPASNPQREPEYPIRWPRHCGKEYNVKTEDFHLDEPTDLSIEEALHQLNTAHQHIFGWIHIVSAPANQALGTVHAKLTYASSPSINIIDIQHTLSGSALTISTPPRISSLQTRSHKSSCLGISLTLSIPPISLQNLNIHTDHLSTQIHPSTDFIVVNSTTISLTSGTLDTSSLHSYSAYLSTTSGSITGSYGLSSNLEILTISGSVNIAVNPASGSLPSAPALFHAKTESGSINIEFAHRSIPERDYRVLVESTVASISGTYIHGSDTSFATNAGSINVDVLPVLANYASTLSTTSISGETSVRVRAPYGGPGVPLRNMTSVHGSVDGRIEVGYPEEWEGVVEGRSGSGALSVKGRELVLVEEGVREEGGKGNFVSARKGEGSLLRVESGSGGVDVRVGRV